MSTRFAAALFLASLLFAAPGARAQVALQQGIAAIASGVRGQVAVACALPGTALRCDLHPDAHPPMQSVFKLPLAIVVLQQVEQGRLSLTQTVRFLPSDRILPHTHSALQDRYPKADVEVPVQDLLRLAAADSDNDAADILLRTVGGPAVVNRAMASLGVAGFHLQRDEQAVDLDARLQYGNWFTPRSAVALLLRLSQHSPLTPQHTAMLLGWMTHGTLPARLSANLPTGTVVAHRTGSGGTYRGLQPTTNDMALITLPDGRKLAIAVFVTDAAATPEQCEAAIARIGRAVYDAALVAR